MSAKKTISLHPSIKNHPDLGPMILKLAKQYPQLIALSQLRVSKSRVVSSDKDCYISLIRDKHTGKIVHAGAHRMKANDGTATEQANSHIDAAHDYRKKNKPGHDKWWDAGIERYGEDGAREAFEAIVDPNTNLTREQANKRVSELRRINGIPRTRKEK